jgi:hypothetical protein
MRDIPPVSWCSKVLRGGVRDEPDVAHVPTVNDFSQMHYLSVLIKVSRSLLVAAFVQEVEELIEGDIGAQAENLFVVLVFGLDPRRCTLSDRETLSHPAPSPLHPVRVQVFRQVGTSGAESIQ